MGMPPWEAFGRRWRAIPPGKAVRIESIMLAAATINGRTGKATQASTTWAGSYSDPAHFAGLIAPDSVLHLLGAVGDERAMADDGRVQRIATDQQHFSST